MHEVWWAKGRHRPLSIMAEPIFTTALSAAVSFLMAPVGQT